MTSQFNNSRFAQPGFPRTRTRRLRYNQWSRNLVAETKLSPQDFIWPLFVSDNLSEPEPIEAMPGVFRYSQQQAVEEVKKARDLGINTVAIFPRVDGSLRTDDGAEALNPRNLVCRTVRAIKQQVSDIGIICDVALDPYTSHGHDGLLIDGEIVNDATVKVLIEQSIIQAEAGCDIIAPSDMMDGRVGAIRDALEQYGYEKTLILSYTAKYASALYAPFRDALSAGNRLVGDKKTYQMDYANRREATLEAELDFAEGADMLMVKPALPYLDIISDISRHLPLPCFAYQVSGEYAMLKNSALAGAFDEKKVVLETLTSIKRAGAAGILTYFALDAAKWL